MKFTLSWLKKHLKTNASIETISHMLTQIGLEVEDIIEPNILYKHFIVGKIIEASKHPEADKLTLCQVDVGKDASLQIICGAPNARAGIYVAVALPGAIVPANQMQIKKGKIRGIESGGMLCASDELGFTDVEESGILELPSYFKTGTSLIDALDLDDPIFEIALTPNRGDCAGVMGIARDLAAAGIGEMIETTFNVMAQQGSNDSLMPKLIIQDKKVCPAFRLHLIKGVKNISSPEHFQKNLRACGVKIISSLVDVTNFFCMDRARPLHVFDADKIQGHMIIRRANQGEKFLALDEETYEMKGHELIISDDSGIISLAGIMGGLSTAVDENTKNTLLECADFDPITIALAGRSHRIDSDSRYRFERGIDFARLVENHDRAAEMLMAFSGGELIATACAGNLDFKPQRVDYAFHLFEKLMGIPFETSKQKIILEALGFKFTHVTEDTALIEVPSWRHDIEGPNDFTEELIRIYGYAHLPEYSLTTLEELPNHTIENPALHALSRLRHSFVAKGYTEVLNWSFLSDKIVEKFGFKTSKALYLQNPINRNWNYMRPSIMPYLLDNVQNNAARTLANFKLFEIGPIFQNALADGQKTMIAGLHYGMISAKEWSGADRPFDLSDIKAAAFLAIKSLGFNPESLRISQTDIPCYYHPGRAGKLYMGKKLIGQFGEIHPDFASSYKLAALPLYGFELILDALPPIKKAKTTTKPAAMLSAYQPVFRDFAFVMDKKIPAQDILRLVSNVDKKLIQDVRLFDLYQGEHIGAGKKSLAFQITIQSMQKTLEDEEIEHLSNKIIQLLEKQFIAELRA